MSKTSFRQQMRLLGLLGYRSISLDELAHALVTGRAIAPRSFVLTFDDGYAGVYDHAFPVLRELGYTGTLFLIAEDYLGSSDKSVSRAFPTLAREQVTSMVGFGFAIGCHTLTHPLTLIEAEEKDLHREVWYSRWVLEHAFGYSVSAFCYPYGRISKDLESLLAKSDYLCACSTSLGSQHRLEERFALRRVSIGPDLDPARFLYRAFVVARRG